MTKLVESFKDGLIPNFTRTKNIFNPLRKSLDKFLVEKKIRLVKTGNSVCLS